LGVSVCSRIWADGDNGDGNDGDDGDGAGAGAGDVMVPKALSQVGRLRQHQCQASTDSSLLLAKASTNSEFNRPKDYCGNASPAEARLSQVRL